VTAGFEDGHSFNARLDQGIFNCIQLGGLDNRFNLEHVQIPRL
jgi:hypothetical protein